MASSIEPDLFQDIHRIVVVGSAGSGKTTFARNLGELLSIPALELDALHWDPDWTPSPRFAVRVERVVREPRWILDGNYSKVRHLVWPRAQALIWLDYPWKVILGRVARRTLRRTLSQEELWNGNREGLKNLRPTPQANIILWAATNYRRKRVRYRQAFQHPELADRLRIRIRRPEAAEALLAALSEL